MAKVAPYHTNSREYPEEVREVHHNHDDCVYGKRIKPEHLIRNDDGGKRLCKECTKLG